MPFLNPKDFRVHDAGLGGIRGGILADEMGLGKTVELLGCILSNRFGHDPARIQIQGSIGSRSGVTACLKSEPVGDGTMDDEGDLSRGTGRKRRRENGGLESEASPMWGGTHESLEGVDPRRCGCRRCGDGLELNTSAARW